MTAYSATKDKIIELLRHKTMALRDIANALRLTSSTIKQHLVELERQGKIKVVSFRTHKYYETV